MRHGNLKALACAISLACMLGLALSANALAVLEFEATKLGSFAGKTLVVPKFESKTGVIVECLKLGVSSGKATTLKSGTETITIEYKECTSTPGGSGTWAPIELELNINGTVKILKTVTFKAGLCTITLPAQTLSTVAYVNHESLEGGKVELVLKLTKIESEGTGTCAYFIEKESKLTDTALLELIGGGFAA